MGMGEDDTSKDKDCDNYLDTLTTFGLDRLKREPRILRDEANSIELDVKKLSMENYSVYIENYNCVRHVRTQIDNVSEGLENLLTELPALGKSSSDFQQRAAQIAASHKRNRQTIQHHLQLLDLLEIPHLIDTCVRSGRLDEGLDLISLAINLERRHLRASAAAARGQQVPLGGSGNSLSPYSSEDGGGGVGSQGINVIHSIVSESIRHALSLRSHLLQRLCAPGLLLPSCLRTVGQIRRLDDLLHSPPPPPPLSTPPRRLLLLVGGHVGRWADG